MNMHDVVKMYLLTDFYFNNHKRSRFL